MAKLAFISLEHSLPVRSATRLQTCPIGDGSKPREACPSAQSCEGDSQRHRPMKASEIVTQDHSTAIAVVRVGMGAIVGTGGVLLGFAAIVFLTILFEN